MIGFARRFHDTELLSLGSAEHARSYIWSALRWGAYVRGLAWNDRVEVMITSEMPGAHMLDLCVWGAARCEELPASPGYDADGRECWEYPRPDHG